MPQISYLKKRGGTYYAQIAVPLELQLVIGAKMKERSLRTKDPREAKRLLPAALQEWHSLFDQARRGAAVAKEQHRPLTNAQMAARLYRSKIEFDAEIRAADHRYAQMGVDYDEARRFRDGSAGRLPNADLEELVGDRIERFRASGFHDHAIGSPEWRSLAQDLCAATYEALARRDERDSGNFTGRPVHPVIANAEPEPETVQEAGGILELFDRYARENAKGISQDTLKQARRDVKLFVETTGVSTPVQIDKKAVRTWKSLLLDYPVKAAEVAAFRGMTMRQIVKKNEKLKKPTIADATVNRYLSALAAFCDWLVRNDYLDRNPTAGLFQLVDKAKRKKSTFTAEQMSRLFASPLFTGALSDANWREPGQVRIRDHRFWIPLVMVYSGARPGEIAQLLVDDVREDRSQWIMHITTLGDDDKSVKTAGSMRVVPVHPELIQLGFVAYRDAMKVAGEMRLFPKAIRNSRGQMVADFSRDFGRYLSKLGLKDGRGLSLYSFRHGFIDALRRAEYLDEQIAFLVGHTAHTMTAQYGQLPQGVLRQRAEMVNAVNYPGLDLSPLGGLKEHRSK